MEIYIIIGIVAIAVLLIIVFIQHIILRRKENEIDVLWQKKEYLKSLLAAQTNAPSREKEIIENQKKEIAELKEKLKLSPIMSSNLKAIPYLSALIASLETFRVEIAALEKNKQWSWGKDSRIPTSAVIHCDASFFREHFEKNLNAKYKLAYLLNLFPWLQDVLEAEYINIPLAEPKSGVDLRAINEWLDQKSRRQETYKTSESHLPTFYSLEQYKNVDERYLRLSSRKTPPSVSKSELHILPHFKSNLTAIPYMAAIIADYETYDLEILAKQLDWGKSYKREEKVASIRSIRASATLMVQKNLEAKYQLEYLLQLFPTLNDVIDSEYETLPNITIEDIKEYDKTRDWLSKEEYQTLSTTERNQLALDRYISSHSKTKWQIGRDYELYIGHRFEKAGYTVDYFGSYMGLEDLGRDLIVKKDGRTIIIQCKYWSKDKTIHEKHITQLYGTVISYCIENSEDFAKVKGGLVTNTTLSDVAIKMANHLGIIVKTGIEKDKYPCIKCNIGKYGEKIYHLPFDQQYDVTKINSPGEFYATTVAEAEAKGFRRAMKYYGE